MMNWSILVLYAVGVTIALLTVYRNRDVTLISEARSLSLKIDAPADRIRALREISQMETDRFPWYERRKSVVGDIVFFSMMLGTGIQTVKSTMETVRIQELQANLDELEERRSEIESLISTVTGTIITTYQRTGVLDLAAKELLEFRLLQLGRDANLNRDEIIEKIQAGLIIGDIASVIADIERHDELFESASAADRISIAQYYYITDAFEMAESIVSDLTNELSAMPTDWRIRALVLSAALTPVSDRDKQIRELAAILEVARGDAERRIIREIQHLNSAASKVRLSRKPTRTNEATGRQSVQ